MRLCHISDTHGNFPKLYGRYDTVIHTGDFFPNSHHVFSNRNREMAFQLQWLRDNTANIKAWLGGHPLLYVPGNHDFLHPDFMEHELRSEGLEVLGLTDKITTFQGINFYGFPYVPPIDGSWNYERQLPEMQTEVDKLVEQVNKTYVDVLACHAPLYQLLDLTIGNQLTGNTVMNNALDYKIDKNMMPAYYLCGHIHEAYGISIRNGMVVSNAATTRHILEI
jgi:Icc-related predicted phosphoesterase